MIRRVFCSAVLAVLAVLGGCSRGGNGDAPPTKTPSPNEPQRTVRPGQHGPIAKGEYALDGAVEVSGDYSVLYSFADEKTSTCGKIAGADATGYVVPLPTFQGERRFVWTAGVREYDGPGTYELTDLGRLTLQVLKTPDSEPVDYVAGKDASAQLEVSAKNGGSFEFDGLESEDGDEVSGRATWSCSEGSEGSEG